MKHFLPIYFTYSSALTHNVLRSVVVCCILFLTFVVSATNISAATDVILLVKGSGKIVAQIQPEPNGSYAFDNLPDGVYKLEIKINGKRFVIDSDIDSDGNDDISVNSQFNQGKVGTRSSNGKYLLTVSGSSRQTLPFTDWQQMIAVTKAPEAVPQSIGIEIRLDNSTIKGAIRIPKS